MSNYYNDNARPFFDNTVAVDMGLLYQQFLPLLPKGAKVVDAGCGSGRDAQYFLSHGYDVSAFDASAELANLASDFTQSSVDCSTFLNAQIPKGSQDGIWACASLLHVPFIDMEITLQVMAGWLKPQGVFYCSFKLGDGEVKRGSRRFTDMNKKRLEAVLQNVDLDIKKVWITGDLRQGREEEQWLNTIMIKV